MLSWNGSRIRRRATISCYADTCCGRLVSCARRPAASKPDCSLGYFECASAVEPESLLVTDKDVIVSALVHTGGLRPR